MKGTAQLISVSTINNLDIEVAVRSNSESPISCFGQDQNELVVTQDSAPERIPLSNSSTIYPLTVECNLQTNKAELVQETDHLY